MKINYDKTADAIYFSVTKSKIQTTKKIADRMIIDIDKKGNIIGIELLEASSQQEVIKNLKKNLKKGIPIAFI
jgi:uncharacterized protein YuzE